MINNYEKDYMGNYLKLLAKIKCNNGGIIKEKLDEIKNK
jgi:hypothetical protein